MGDAATGGLAAGTALEGLPAADEIGARASGENFSVASILLGRETRVHLLAIYGYARLVDEIGDAVPGDRLALLDAFEADLARVFDGPGPPLNPVLRLLQPTVASLQLPAPALRAADRGQPPRPGARRLRAPTRSCSPTATSRPTRSASSSCTSSGPRAPTGSRSPTASAPHSSSPSTGRTSPRTTGPAASTSPPRISSASASPRPSSRGDVTAPRSGGCSPSRSRAPAGSSTRARRSSAAARAGTDRRRRLRRRRPGRARGDRRGRLRRPRGPAAGRPRAAGRRDAHDRTSGADEPDRDRPGLRALPPHRPRRRGSSFYAGMRLLPADRRAALFAIYALARRIDDIADGPLAAGGEARRARSRAGRGWPSRRPTRSCSRSPTPPAASRSRSRPSAT